MAAIGGVEYVGFVNAKTGVSHIVYRFLPLPNPPKHNTVTLCGQIAIDVSDPLRPRSLLEEAPLAEVKERWPQARGCRKCIDLYRPENVSAFNRRRDQQERETLSLDHLLRDARELRSGATNDRLRRTLATVVDLLELLGDGREP